MNVAADRWEQHARERYDALVQDLGKRVSFDDFRARIEPSRMPMIRHVIAETAEKIPVEMDRMINAMVNERIGILSLCEHPDNLLMWAHYGDGHRGFALEFDTASSFFRQLCPPAHVKATPEEAEMYAEEYGRLRRVDYSDDRPSVVVTDFNFDTLLTKSTAWRYEHEWRMLMPPSYADRQLPSESGHAVCLFAIPPSAVTAVILGCNADEEILTNALALRDQPETRHIAIKNTRIDTTQFRLIFEVA